MFTDMVGNVQAYILFIGLAVVFSLCLVAGNAMAMSMRERTTEIAVLKAIGFSKLRVLWMILGESVCIAALGALLGVTMGCVLMETIHQAAPRVVPISIADMAGAWMGLLVLTGAGIGLISGIVPSINAARLSVVNGLRRVV
jgi:putative ABC transport system permease protein